MYVNCIYFFVMFTEPAPQTNKEEMLTELVAAVPKVNHEEKQHHNSHSSIGKNFICNITCEIVNVSSSHQAHCLLYYYHWLGHTVCSYLLATFLHLSIILHICLFWKFLGVLSQGLALSLHFILAHSLSHPSLLSYTIIQSSYFMVLRLLQPTYFYISHLSQFEAAVTHLLQCHKTSHCQC